MYRKKYIIRLIFCSISIHRSELVCKATLPNVWVTWYKPQPEGTAAKGNIHYTSDARNEGTVYKYLQLLSRVNVTGIFQRAYQYTFPFDRCVRFGYSGAWWCACKIIFLSYNCTQRHGLNIPQSCHMNARWEQMFSQTWQAVTHRRAFNVKLFCKYI